jgi:hypothetical protein
VGVRFFLVLKVDTTFIFYVPQYCTRRIMCYFLIDSWRQAKPGSGNRAFVVQAARWCDSYPGNSRSVGLEPGKFGKRDRGESRHRQPVGKRVRMPSKMALKQIEASCDQMIEKGRPLLPKERRLI